MEPMRIPLSRAGLFALVDAADYGELSKYRWHLDSGGYAQRRWYDAVTKGEHGMFMHRQILKPPPDLDVDHVNFDKLDNRRCNIRIATTAQNSRKRRLSKDNVLRLKGVSRRGYGYQTRITFEGRTRHVGFFHDPESAARAYDDAARRLFGDFAVVNFD